MRQTYKGAAALAAICAGALAFGPVASANDYVPGFSGNTANYGRIAGIDRIQTALEAATATPAGSITRFYLVGYGSQVDALTLAPWNCGDNGYVLFVKNGLEQRHIEALEANPTAQIFIIGGTASVSSDVEMQLAGLAKEGKITPSKFARVAGADRYDTAYQVGAFVLDKCLGDDDKAYPAHQLIDNDNKTIQAYLDAQKTYVAKSKAYVEANADVEKAVAAQGMAFAELVKQASKHIDTTTLQDDYDTAEAEYKAAKTDAAEKKELLKVIIDGLATTDFNIQESDLKRVTIKDFIDKYATFDDAKQKELKPVMDKLDKVIEDHLANISEDDTLQSAIGKAKAEFTKLDKAYKTFVEKIGAMYDALYEKMQAEANNAKIVKDVAMANKAYKDATKAREDAEDALAKAETELNEAIAKLAEATEPYLVALRDLPGHQKGYRTVLDKIYTDTTAPIFVSDGVGFADALAAGPAARKMSGVVLLTKGTMVPDITNKALDESKSQSVAIGGIAAKAMDAAFSQAAVRVVGADRYATAVEVAKRYFTDGIVMCAALHEVRSFDGPCRKLFALASGENGADAMAAGTYLTSNDGAAILLTRANSLPKVTDDFLSYGRTNSEQGRKYVSALAIFGGPHSISDAVQAAAVHAMNDR